MNQIPAMRAKWFRAPFSSRDSGVLSATLSGGKAKKLALTACLRKLLTILNAMLKNGTPWRVAASQPA